MFSHLHTSHTERRPRRARFSTTTLAASLAAAFTLTGTLTTPVAMAQSAAAQAVAYNIAAGPLEGALTAFARSAGVLLVYQPELVRGQTSPGVQGSHAPAQALTQLLAGTGLQAVVAENGTWTLRRTAAATPVAPAASSAPADGVSLAEVRVTAKAEADSRTEGTASYTAAGPSAAATGLPLTLRETPQSVTIMTRQRLEDFQLDTLEDVLVQTPGVTVSRQGDMTTFNMRGSNANLKVDGNRLLSTGWGWNTHILYTLDDMAEIDRIEVLKGSSGLVNGDGNYGGTVNLVRKRPTREFQASAKAGVGSWNSYRAEGDISGPLNAAGTLRGRLVAAHREADGFRDNQHSRADTLYGTVEADLSPDTVLSGGLIYKERVLRGSSGTTPIQAYSGIGVAVPLMPRSYTNGASWGGYDQESLGLFARLEHRFSNGWSAKLQLARDTVDTPELKIGYLQYQLPGAVQYGRYANIKDRNDSVSVDVQGPFELLGRRHELLFGAGLTRARTTLLRGSVPGSTLAAAGLTYEGGGGAIVEPSWAGVNYSNDLFSRKNRYVYATSRINIADPVKLIVGARVSDFDQKDVTDVSWYNYDMRERGVVTPYAGLVVDVSPNVSLYASHASIYKPQSAKDVNERTLDPEKGETSEIGAKGEFFNKRLNASVSAFWMRTDNTAETVGINASGGTISRAIQGASRRGYELEISGELARGWQAQGSYVLNSSNLSSASTTPEHQFKLATSYRIGRGALQGLTLGAAVRWQSAISTSRSGATLRQDAYWVTDLMARYQVNRHLSLALNIDNLFDQKYFAGVTNFTSQGLFYTWGAPRSVNVSMRYDF